MALIEDIKKLETWQISAALVSFLATVAPGSLILYLYEPALFRELETFKLLVLSAAVTLPVVLVNILLTAVIGSFTGRLKKANKSQFYFLQMLWAFFVLYGTLLVAYFCSLSIKQFIMVAGGLNVFVAVIVFFLFKFMPRVINKGDTH